MTRPTPRPPAGRSCGSATEAMALARPARSPTSCPSCWQAWRRGRNAVLVAPPGAGKTTLVPLALLDAAWAGERPHPAARAAPARRPRRRAAHGRAARRRGRRHGRLRHAHGEPAVGEDAHPGRHRRHSGAHDPRRSGTARHRARSCSTSSTSARSTAISGWRWRSTCKARCGPTCGCSSCRRRSTARGSPGCSATRR